jgi:hypothetical protein
LLKENEVDPISFLLSYGTEKRKKEVSANGADMMLQDRREEGERLWC